MLLQNCHQLVLFSINDGNLYFSFRWCTAPQPARCTHPKSCTKFCLISRYQSKHTRPQTAICFMAKRGRKFRNFYSQCVGGYNPGGAALWLRCGTHDVPTPQTTSYVLQPPTTNVSIRKCVMVCKCRKPNETRTA